jgi:hypothetical protein
LDFGGIREGKGVTRNTLKYVGGKYSNGSFIDIGRSSMDWIHLALVREMWRALSDTIMNIPVP